MSGAVHAGVTDGIVAVSGGKVRGHRPSSVWAFFGVPYAGSPGGAGRWRPPTPPEPWAGVRTADGFGPIAPQAPPSFDFAVPSGTPEQSEDCLTLNVWTPGLDERRRPVMVWIHGGGFTSGTGSAPLYEGTALAEVGDVVVVTINYRLGALGFLGHPELADGAGQEGIGNWGLMDQVAALRWVRRHIADFGGDPDNVTVFGESAGAMSISALLGAPAARGLFGRAILQSGPPYTHTEEEAVSAAGDLAAELGLAGPTRRALEQVPAADLVAATEVLQGRPPRPGQIPLPLLPVLDGRFLSRPPQAAVRGGDHAGVTLMVGTNRDEVALQVFADPKAVGMDDDQLRARVRRAAPTADPETVVAHYRTVRAARGEGTGPRDMWIAIGSDLVFRLPTLRLAAAQGDHQGATYVYLFTWVTPIFGGVLGSCHALEIPFVFGSVRRPSVAGLTGGGPEAEELSRRMQLAWTAFARTGDPTHPEAGAWPAWDDDRRTTMVLGPDGGPVDAPRNDELAVWGTDPPDDMSDG